MADKHLGFVTGQADDSFYRVVQGLTGDSFSYHRRPLRIAIISRPRAASGLAISTSAQRSDALAGIAGSVGAPRLGCNVPEGIVLRLYQAQQARIRSRVGSLQNE